MLSCDDSLSIDTLSLNDSLVLAILVSTIFTQCVFEIDKGKVRVSIIKIMERLTWKNLGVNTQTRLVLQILLSLLFYLGVNLTHFQKLLMVEPTLQYFPKF